MRPLARLLLTVSVVGGCGGGADPGRVAPPTATAPMMAAPASPSTTSSLHQPPATAAPVTTVDVGPPVTAPRTTVPIVNPPPVRVDRRAELEERVAEFELLDPRRDPARYLTLSTSECRRLVSERVVRETGTAQGGGVLSTAEQRRLDLLERGTRVVGIDIIGYRPNRAQVEVRLEGDPPRHSGRVRQWTLEDGAWNVGSCLQ